MAEALVLLGAFCVIAAIVGGGLTLSSVGSMPVVDSWRRQLILAVCGGALIAGGLALRGDDEPQNGPGSIAPQSVIPSDGEREEPSMTVAPKTARPGTRLTVDARGFQPGERVTVEFGVDELGSFTANTQGRIADAHVRIPADHGFAGRDEIQVSGEQSLTTVSRPIEIKCKKGYERRLNSCIEPGTPGVDDGAFAP